MPAPTVLRNLTPETKIVPNPPAGEPVIATRADLRDGSRPDSGGGGTPAEPSVLYPNKPAWATTDVFQVDGTVAEANGSAFGIPEFGAWFRAGSADSSLITVVSDTDNPLGNNSAINLEWVNSEAGVAFSEEFGSTGFDKLYFMFRVKMIGTVWESSGNKFFYFGEHGGSSSSHYFDRPSGQNPGKLRMINQSGSGDVVIMDTSEDTGSLPLIVDQVLNIEGAIDKVAGTTESWVNGVRVGGKSATLSPTKLNRFQWYGKANSGSFSGTANMRLYEWYVAGESA